MGTERQSEIRVTVLGLAVLAVLVAALAIWAAMSVGQTFRSQTPNISATQSSINR